VADAIQARGGVVTRVVVDWVPVFPPRPAFCFVTSRLRVRFCDFAPARSHNRRIRFHLGELAVPTFTAGSTHRPLCVLCVPLRLRSSAPLCVNLRTTRPAFPLLRSLRSFAATFSGRS